MSTFQNAIAFFVNLGVYDVVLPFLLVFTIVFALLEKTKVLGLEKDDDGDMRPKKNLNAMVAFVAGFLIIASTELVRVINEVTANVVLLLLLAVLFLLLAGSVHKDEEFFFDEDSGWRTFLTVILFIGIVLIFLNALGWLDAAWRYTITHLDGPVVGSFAMLVVVVAAMWGVVNGSSGSKDES